MGKNFGIIYLADANRSKELSYRLANSVSEWSVADSFDAMTQTIASSRVDLVILENEQKGFFTGLEVLEKVYSDLLRPTTILLAEPTAEVKKNAKRIGVDAVLEPRATMEEIGAAVQSLITSKGVGPLYIRPLARKVVHDGVDVAPLPQLIVRISKYLDEGADVSIEDLANDIAVDPKATAELLRLINSASMGIQRKIVKPFDAVNFLGVRRTISIIMAATLVNSSERLRSSLPPADQQWYNRRSVLIASAAYVFAKRLGEVAPDTAFVLGIFQEIGILAMARALSSKYVPLLQKSRETGPLRLERLEESYINVNHAEVGAALLLKWGMPSTLVAPILDHHHPEKFPEKTDLEQKYLRIMQVAEALANLSDGHSSHRFPVLKSAMDAFGPEKAEQCKQAMSDSVAKALESGSLFRLPLPDPSALKLMVGEILVRLRDAEK